MCRPKSRTSRSGKSRMANGCSSAVRHSASKSTGSRQQQALLLRAEHRRPVNPCVTFRVHRVGCSQLAEIRTHQVGAVAGAQQPAIHHLARAVLACSDVLTDLLAYIASKFGPIARRTAVAILVVKKVLIGHCLRMTLCGSAQNSVPDQWRGSSEGLRSALTRLGTGVIDHFQNFLPFYLPIAKTRSHQRACQDNAPVSPLPANPDVDKLRVQHYPAKTLQHRFKCRVSVIWAGQTDRLHSDHWIGGTRQRLLQVQIATGGQHQTCITGQWRQLHGYLLATALCLTTIGVDGFDQLRIVAGQRSTGKDCRVQQGHK
ncbi:hypothetical protein ALP96_01042 [Pseudomonas savastanoi pv. glycinea]|nr:hypothetical protein ALP96_01042 [Pseudomonas savastanoi pv. glycinea]